MGMGLLADWFLVGFALHESALRKLADDAKVEGSNVFLVALGRLEGIQTSRTIHLGSSKLMAIGRYVCERRFRDVRKRREDVSRG